MDKCALFYIDNIMLYCHVTYLVAINKLSDATVTYLAQFLDSTCNTQTCSILNMIVAVE